MIGRLLLILAVATVGCSTKSDVNEAHAGHAHAGGVCEHHIPKAACPKCNPALAAVYKAKSDWCEAHGFPDSFCPACKPGTRPAVSTKRGDWCPSHNLPESKCTKCDPDLIFALKSKGDWCSPHGFSESACPVCRRPAGTPAPSVIEPGTKIRFRTAEIESAAGLQVVVVSEAAMGVGVQCTARLLFNQNRVADIRAPVPGVVREVHVDLGDPVDVGSSLFTLESPRVGQLQGQLRAAVQRAEVARANFGRQRDLHESNITSVRQLELARQEQETVEAELHALKSSLRIAGASSKNGRGRFVVRAPKKGTITRRPATFGTFATEAVSLATIADTSSLWAILDVREIDAKALRNGQQVTLQIDGLPDRSFTGKITWVASEVNPRTRTVQARAEVSNQQGLLRAQQFARATIDVANEKNAIAVPRRAIQRLGEETLVFVRTSERIYEPRSVLLGRSTKDYVQVIGAVRSGDALVTDGAFLLKTELVKDNIGAGCCEVEGPK